MGAAELAIAVEERGLDALFIPEAFSWEQRVAPQQRGGPLYRIEHPGFVANEQLHLEWTYSQAYHHEQTIQQFAKQFMHRLRALITHCQAPESGRYTASDFAEAELNQEELEELLSELGEL